MLPYFALLWVYLRLVPQPPLLVDVLVFPGSLLLWVLILRRLDLRNRFRNPDDDRFQVRGVNAVRLIMCYSFGLFLLTLWVLRRHEETIPESVFTAMLAIGAVGYVVSLPFTIAYFVMEFVAWRRKRRARAAGVI
jgi:hypothetical protein